MSTCIYLLKLLTELNEKFQHLYYNLFTMTKLLNYCCITNLVVLLQKGVKLRKVWYLKHILFEEKVINLKAKFCLTIFSYLHIVFLNSLQISSIIDVNHKNKKYWLNILVLNQSNFVDQNIY